MASVVSPALLSRSQRGDCKQRAIRIEVVEERVAAHYASVQLPPEEVAALRSFLGEELSKLRLTPSATARRRSGGCASSKPSARSCWTRTTPTPCRSTCSRASRIVSRPGSPTPKAG